MYRHQKSVHQGLKYSCDQCDKILTSHEKLKNHQKSVHFGQKLDCDLCEKQFNLASALSKHKRVVHRKVKYDCDQCNKTFNNQIGRTAHKKKVHQGINFECKDCGKEYSSGSNLSRHRKQHNKGISTINESFNSNEKDEANCEDQVKIEELDWFESFPCEKCGISLSSLKLLRMHNVMVHHPWEHLIKVTWLK